ncbi:DMT family transporter [Thalassovita taeanensis]|uniref:EamA domain-containing membrane protein RarD n=1 Tax=Thalassovita taeanensis TaxID=657014 RepID=A0A1H8YY96_9RHOB|nr:DMT family transporter [Thalassovita taeanensis]SEP57154.1 EamA domain-containing membrane protein RarD [Thalassovita taeanensis]
MERKDRIDAIGALALTGFAIVLAFNQVVIKLGNGGFQPVFMAGLRSLGALVVLLVWMRIRGVRLSFPVGTVVPGLLLGGLFAFEFVCLFWALDHTSVARASILFYSMPVILSLAAHFTLPGERLTPLRLLGLGLAMAGVAVVLSQRNGGQASLLGDLAALGAACGWAGIALSVRLTSISKVVPEMQLWWQLVVSSVLLLGLAPLFGPLLRDPGLWHVAGLMYQIIAVASFGFLFWFFLMKIYPASSVASFSFLSPVISVVLGWLILGEQIGGAVIVALVLVALGIVLINRRPAS